MTRNKEDYLKIIYELGGQKKIVSNKSIAEALGVSAPSVSEMINKLLQDGYVEYTLYKGVSLTQLGLEKAMEIRRRHLLWEVFLVEKLGYDWEDVHEEAEKLEHVTSRRLEGLLDKYLNYPRFCPHGSPIIESEEDIINFTSISSLPLCNKRSIVRFEDDRELLKFTREKDLKIGDKIELIQKVDNDLFIVMVNDKKIELEERFAKGIYIE